MAANVEGQIIRFDRTAGPDLLRFVIEFVPPPVRGAVRAFGLSRAEFLVREGRYPKELAAVANFTLGALADGAFEPVIDSVFKLANIVVANARLNCAFRSRRSW